MTGPGTTILALVMEILIILALVTMTIPMTMLTGDGGGGERGGGGRGVGDGHPGHREDRQLQQGELAFVNVLWYAWLPCEEMQKI